MSDICEVCGSDRKNRACKETLLDYLENPKVVSIQTSEYYGKISLADGGNILLSDCDVCNIRKVKYVFGD